MEKISYNKNSKKNSTHKFSIVIPTWNNLSLLKICIDSIIKNSHFQHQIVLHINDGTDGSLDWVKKQNIDYTYSKTNVGICWAMNACRNLVETDYIVYLNDDMYVLPNWDLELWNEIEKLPNDLFFLSSTIIEPRKSPHKGVISPYNYGNDATTFEEEKLLQEYKQLPSYDWHGATWPPNIVSTRVWDLVGGYSIEYSPGLYSDPDFSMKLLKLGVTIFKGVSKSMAYHFGSKSTQRVKMNKGNRQFVNKWGITSSTMCKYILRRGEKITKPIDVTKPEKNIALAKLKSQLKRIILSFKTTGQTQDIM